jgi:lipoyl(octanoyl) transferase
MSAPHTVTVHRADEVDYRAALDWQLATASALRAAREATTGAEALALIQHQPVYTLGARADTSNVLASEAALAARGAEVVAVDRGGDVTFHGPGQLVAYPILDLRQRNIRPVSYVRLLEQTVIDTLEQFGLIAERESGRPGVWIGGAKVAAVGVRVQGGISTHGLALNVAPDLGWFDAIVPCGLPDAEVTSMARLLDDAPPFEHVIDTYRAVFAEHFESTLVDATDSPLVAPRPDAVPA